MRCCRFDSAPVHKNMISKLPLCHHHISSVRKPPTPLLSQGVAAAPQKRLPPAHLLEGSKCIADPTTTTRCRLTMREKLVTPAGQCARQGLAVTIVTCSKQADWS